ncbi:hypothetical protein COOONC_16734, partial [Cooperia oncophora]
MIKKIAHHHEDPEGDSAFAGSQFRRTSNLRSNVLDIVRLFSTTRLRASHNSSACIRICSDFISFKTFLVGFANTVALPSISTQYRVDQRSNRMPPKVQRSKRTSDGSSQLAPGSSSVRSTQTTLSDSSNFASMSAMELLKSIIELNQDPAIENMLIALSEKIPKEFSDFLEGDKRERSIVIAGLEEAQGELPPSARQSDLEGKVSKVLDALDVECRLCETYRMGKPKIVTNFPYFLYRLDRKERRGGGVCCLVRGNLHVHSVDRASPNKADVLCVDLLCPHNASRIRFILVYRPPNMSKNEDEELIDVLRDTRSRLRLRWQTLITPLFVSKYWETSSYSTVPLPDFLNVDYRGLDGYLSTVDWLTLFDQYVSMDDVYQRFCRLLYHALSLFVPMKVREPRPLRYPPHITNLLTQKERLFCDLEFPLSSSLYKKVCSDVDRHLKKFIASLERRLGRQTSLKRLYSYIGNKLKSKCASPALEDQSGTKLCSEFAKAEALGRYFASVFLTADAHNSAEDEPKWSYDSIRGFPDIYFHPFNVYTVLKNLKPSISEPMDGIPQI